MMPAVPLLLLGFSALALLLAMPELAAAAALGRRSPAPAPTSPGLRELLRQRDELLELGEDDGFLDDDFFGGLEDFGAIFERPVSSSSSGLGLGFGEDLDDVFRFDPVLDLEAGAIGSSSRTPSGPLLLDADRKASRPYRPSVLGLEFIKAWEKFSPVVYDPLPNDGRPEPTIGYGHLVKAGESFGSITIARARELLESDVREICLPALEAIRSALTQTQVDALASLVFNIGAPRFLRSDGFAFLQSGNVEAAALQFGEFRLAGGNVSSGLVRRRKLEGDLLLGRISIEDAIDIV